MRQSAAYRTIATCGGIVVAATVLLLGVAVATWPSPPPPGTTDERQAGYRMERGAGAYAHALFEADRAGPLTEAGLAAVPRPAEGAVEVVGLSRQGDTTLVTFSTHGLYGRPGDLQETTACYRVELVGRLDHPNVKKEPDRLCSGPARTPDPGPGTPSPVARLSAP